MGGAWAELRRRITAWEGAHPGVSTHSFAWRGKEGVLPCQTASACVKCTAGSEKKKRVQGWMLGGVVQLLHCSPKHRPKSGVRTVLGEQRDG